MNFLLDISAAFVRRFRSPSALLRLFLRITLGMFLFFSGVGKLIDASAAARFLESLLRAMNTTLPLAPQTLLFGVSLVEIALSAMFLGGRFLKPAIIATGFMLALFTGLLINATGDNALPTCGCSGAFDVGMPLEMAILRNILLMAINVVLWNTIAEAERTHPLS